MNVLLSKSALKAYFIVFITSFLFFYEFGLNNIYNSLNPYIATEFHLSPTQMGFVASLFFYTDLLFLVPAGAIVDRFSPRRVITVVLIVSSSGVLLTAMAKTLAWLIASRLLMGFGGGFCLVACIRVAVNWIPPKQMALVTGLIISMGMLGGVMVQAPLTLLINHLGWRQSVLVVSIIGYVVALMIFLIVHETPKGTEAIIQNRKEQLQQIGVFKSLRISLLRGQNWLAGSYTSLINLPIFMLGALWGIPYLTQVHGQTMTQAATISGMLYFGSMFGMPAMGALSDKMHRRRLPMQIGAILSIILIMVIIISPSNNFWFLLTSFFLLGFITSVQVISYPLVVEINPKMISSTCTCVISMLCMGGGALIQPLFGYMLTSHGKAMDVNNVMAYPASSYLFAMKALPIAFIIALGLTFFIKETYCQHHD